MKTVALVAGVILTANAVANMTLKAMASSGGNLQLMAKQARTLLVPAPIMARRMMR